MLSHGQAFLGADTPTQLQVDQAVGRCIDQRGQLLDRRLGEISDVLAVGDELGEFGESRKRGCLERTPCGSDVRVAEQQPVSCGMFAPVLDEIEKRFLQPLDTLPAAYPRFFEKHG